MQTKRIKCPNCQVVLDVTNSKNEQVKQITCPKCQAVLQVKFPPQQAPLEAETYYAPKKPTVDSGATQLAGCNYGATQLVISEHSRVEHLTVLAVGGTSPQAQLGI